MGNIYRGCKIPPKKYFCAIGRPVQRPYSCTNPKNRLPRVRSPTVCWAEFFFPQPNTKRSAQFTWTVLNDAFGSRKRQKNIRGNFVRSVHLRWRETARETHFLHAVCLAAEALKGKGMKRVGWLDIWVAANLHQNKANLSTELVCRSVSSPCHLMLFH